MTNEQIVALVGQLSWPLVALVVLTAVLKSNFVKANIVELLKVSKAVDDLKPILNDLIIAEERLRETGNALSGSTESVDTLANKINELDAAIGLIHDKIDQRPQIANTNTAVIQKQLNPVTPTTLKGWYDEMDKKWLELTADLEKVFGYFDKRATGSAVFRFAHGNRRDRLPIEMAEDISRLHSEIKSYRRRQSNLEDWLDRDTYKNFLRSSDDVIQKLKFR